MCIHKHYYNWHWLCTDLHLHNFGVKEITAYTACMQTNFYIHKITYTQIFKVSSPTIHNGILNFLTSLMINPKHKIILPLSWHYEEQRILQSAGSEHPRLQVEEKKFAKHSINLGKWYYIETFIFQSFQVKINDFFFLYLSTYPKTIFLDHFWHFLHCLSRI